MYSVFPVPISLLQTDRQTSNIYASILLLPAYLYFCSYLISMANSLRLLELSQALFDFVLLFYLILGLYIFNRRPGS